MFMLPLSSFNVGIGTHWGSGTLFPSNEIGETAAVIGPNQWTFTYTRSGGHMLEVDDSRWWPYHDFNDELDDDQTLTHPVTIGSNTYSAGARIAPQYGYRIEGSDGSVIDIYAVSINYSGYSPIDGVVTTAQLQPGVTYTVKSVFAIANVKYSDLNAICFTAGTLIETDAGMVAVERLAAGDLVRTQDRGMQPILWHNCRTLSAADLRRRPELRPIRITAGALGGDLPERDLILSPQHRLLVRSKIAQRICGRDEVLVAAKQLVALDGVERIEDAPGVTYVHFMCAHHEIVFAEGAPAESFYPGMQGLRALTPEARREVLTLFPEWHPVLGDTRPDPARYLAIGREGRALAARHQKNQKQILAPLI